MCGYLLRIGSGVVMAACLATAAMADPPVFNNQSRWHGNWVHGGLCTDVENGYFCRDITGWENYDVKGTFQFVEVAIANTRYRYDPSDGRWLWGERDLRCPVDEDAITAHPNRVTLEATLDPEAPGCSSWGHTDSWDPVNGYQSEPWLFPLMDVTGEWADPFSHGKSVVNQKGMNYDGWSGTTSAVAQHCNRRWGDLMRSGGFSIGTRSYEFQGPEGAAWSSYNLDSCNDRSMQH
jgi:hypothetical protein